MSTVFSYILVLCVKWSQWGFVHYSHLLVGFCPGGVFSEWGYVLDN